MSDKPWAETQPLEAITGLNRPFDWQEQAPEFVNAETGLHVEELPDAFDWSDCHELPPVNRQAWNDCWAQGSTGVTELLAQIHGERGNERGSVQHQIDCSGAGTARNGGYWTFNFQTRAGLATAAEYPYRGNDGSCRSVTPKWKLKRWGYVGARGRGPTKAELKLALRQFGPLGTTIAANGALQSHRGAGIFRGCSRGSTNHIEVITGYKTVDGELILKVRNSWGESHGDRGYAWIPYGCSQCGTEDVTYAVLAKP